MSWIAESVGPGAPDKERDVRIVQELLGRHTAWLWPTRPPVPTGRFDAETSAAILRFQQTACALKHPDGRVSPTGFTISQLARNAIPAPKNKVFSPVCWNRSAGGLTQNDFDAAARKLGCKSAAIQAVATTETRKSPWDEEGRPTILFERHYFSRLTHRRFDKTHPDISSHKPRGYGTFSEQYSRLKRAATLDETAALESASWGAFQIMGANYAALGFSSVDVFVDAMVESEQKHLDAFVAFIASSKTMTNALKSLDWAAFAAAYNGPSYKDNNYDQKMEAAYKANSGPEPARPGAPGR